MEKIVNRLINDAVVGVDKYTNNGSTWLIFTETKQWVIELTKEGTLWYNYNYFKNLFNYLGFDVIENQHYITKWVEDTIINGVKDTSWKRINTFHVVEDTIINGVKETKGINGVHGMNMAIQNGVKHTHPTMFPPFQRIEYTIQNGVKRTYEAPDGGHGVADEIIQNGIKETYDDVYDNKSRVDGVIKNGIKQTCAQIPSIQPVVERILEEGILQTKPMDEWVNTNRIVDKVILNGDKLN